RGHTSRPDAPPAAGIQGQGAVSHNGGRPAGHGGRGGPGGGHSRSDLFPGHTGSAHAGGACGCAERRIWPDRAEPQAAGRGEATGHPGRIPRDQSADDRHLEDRAVVCRHPDGRPSRHRVGRQARHRRQAMTRQGVWRGLISQHGLSMLEMTLVLLTASLLSWAAMAAYATVERDRERAQGLAQAQQMQVALRAYAMRHGRLPCPDTGGTGYVAAGCPAGALVGGYPYAGVGLVVPPPGLRARDAVLRQASATPGQDADLAVTLERTGDVPGDLHHQDVTDLIVEIG